MSPEPVVIDISSDEEDAVFDGSGKDPLVCNSSLDWLSKMLELEDEQWPSKGVVDVDELNCTAGMQTTGSVGSFMAKLNSDDSDDDCKVLDGDPDKPVEDIQNEGNGSDEILIVGEKGQVACRDFPHSRHLCATFPFGTTSHEKFCKLCHCYVCDVPAPCTFWGTGSSNADHCHSSDKEEKWKLQRKALRPVNKTAAVNIEKNAVVTPSIGRSGMRPPSMRVPEIRRYRNNLPQTMSSTSMHMGPLFDKTYMPLHGPAPAQTSIPLQNSSSRMHTLYPCSATSFGAPSIISQGRNQHSGIVHAVHRFTEHERVRKYSGIDGTEKERGSSPQLLRAHARSRMAGGAAFRNGTTKRPRTTIAQQTQVYSSKVQRTACIPAPSIDERIRELQDVLLGRDSNPETDLGQCGIYSQPKVDSHSYTRAGAGIGTDLLNNPTPVTSNPNCPHGGWLNAGSASATYHVSLADPPLPNVCTVDLYAVPEGSSVPGGVALEELMSCPGREEPPQKVAGDNGLKELGQCTYDDQELLNSLLDSQVNG